MARPKESTNTLMQWTRSEALALAQQSCTFCYGLGLRPGRAGRSSPCNCIFRAIFRACYERFRNCVSKEKHVSRISLDPNHSGSRRSVWGLKDEEYVADFCLVSRRLLTADEHRIFRYHHLLGADWKLCCQKLNIDRGSFFHQIYRVEQKLGRGFRELQPYALFPLDEYFRGVRREEPTRAHPIFAFETGPDADEFAEDVIAKHKRSKASSFPLKVIAAGSSGD